MKSNEILNLIEEITRLDGSKYFEISNMVQNGRAETAAIKGFIKEVRILQLNIPRSKNLIKYEEYINQNFVMPSQDMSSFQEWDKTPQMKKILNDILRENHIA